MALVDAGDDVHNRLAVGHVEHDGLGRAARSADPLGHGFELVAAARRQDDVVTVRAKALGDGPTEASRGARDEGDARARGRRGAHFFSRCEMLKLRLVAPAPGETVGTRPSS